MESFKEEPARNKRERGIKKTAQKEKRKWIHESLYLAIDASDSRYAMGEVSKTYGILRTSITEHYIGKRETKRIGLKGILTMAEEQDLVYYMEEMVRMSCPLNTTHLKLKVMELIQTRMIPFKNGILEKSWIKWFRLRHPQLELKKPEAFDMNRIQRLCPTNVLQFYENLERLYLAHHYDLDQIWNL